MKITRTNLMAFVLGFFISLVVVGCEKKPEQYGQAVSLTETTAIKQILSAPESFADKKVAIEGKITAVCPSGCWFDMESEGLEMHVDINPSGFIIPQIKGSHVIAEGTVKVKDNQATFIGTGVAIK